MEDSEDSSASQDGLNNLAITEGVNYHQYLKLGIRYYYEIRHLRLSVKHSPAYTYLFYL